MFTNLTQDHLDYHGTLDAYFKAKAEWFHELAANPLGKKPVAVINIDDAQGAALAAELAGGPLDLWTVSVIGPVRMDYAATIRDTSTPSTSTPRMSNSGFSYSLASRCIRSRPAETRCAIGVCVKGDSGWL